MEPQLITSQKTEKIELDKKKVLYENSHVTGLIHLKLRILYTANMLITITTILCSFSIFDLTHSFEGDGSFSDSLIEKRAEYRSYMLIYSSIAAVTLSVLEFITKYLEM